MILFVVLMSFYFLESNEILRSVGWLKLVVTAEASILFVLLVYMFFKLKGWDRLFIGALITALGGSALDRYLTGKATLSSATDLDVGRLEAYFNLIGISLVVMGLAVLIATCLRALIKENGSQQK